MGEMKSNPAGQSDALPLPPLPKAGYVTGGDFGHEAHNAFTPEQMRDYARAALAARQPVGEPVCSAQPGKRVGMLEAACGPDRKFDPAAADAELASIPLVPLWDLPELHPRKVADECLTTMEQVRQGTKPHTSRRHKLTETITLTKRFIEQQERSERLCTAPPAQAVDLGQFRECVELMEWQERGHANPDFPTGDPTKHAEALRLLALIDSQAVGNG